jgi:hypothetical protein
MATVVLGAVAGYYVGTATLGAALLTSAIVTAGALIDSLYLYPALFPAKGQSKPQRFLDLQLPTADPGDPRVIAFGSDGVRVPCHVLFLHKQDELIGSGSGGKRGLRLYNVFVFGDLAIAVNDRLTREFVQLIADGKLVYFSSLNLVRLRSHRMTVVESSTNLVLTASSVIDDDFSGYFGVNETAKLSNFTPNANNGYWKISSLAGHVGSTPSTMTLARRAGQNPANGTAGTVTSPGIVERVDDAIIENDYTIGQDTVGNLLVTRNSSGTSADFARLFKAGDRLTVEKYTPSGLNQEYSVDWVTTESDGRGISMRLAPLHNPQVFPPPYTAGTATDAGIVRFTTQSGPAVQMFRQGTQDNIEFLDGSASQTAPALIESHESEVPGYRGVAIATLDELNLTNFGNRLPIFEVVVRPDATMTFAEAIRALVKLGKMPNPDSTVDLSGASEEQLRGYYVRGPQPIAQSLQPLLIAKQMVTQERRDQMAVFQIGNADVVGVAAEDLAARKLGDSSKSTLTVERVEDAQLPTAVGVSFIDSSRNFGRGYESYGLRNPASLPHDNRMELDLRPLSLTRPQARDIAAKTLRRAWINREVVSLDLPPSYMHLLENDLITLDDVLGRDWVVRTIHVQVTTDWVVKVRGVVEEVAVEIANVGARGPGGSTPPRTRPPTTLSAHVLDVPAVSDLHAREPGLYLCAAPFSDGWAGAVAYYSDDNVSWNLIDTLQTPHVLGEATTALATGSTLTVDVTNTVTVSMLNGETLASVTLDDVGRGANWFLLGSEVIAFLTATLQSDGTYILSNLVRGLRDTSDHMASHAIGDRFVRWTAFGEHGIWWPFPDGWAGNGRRRYIKIVPAGGLLADVTAIDITPRAETARCFRPVNVAVTRSSNNATITWDAVPRSPLAQMFQKVQLDERAEEYVVQVFSDGTFGTAVHQFRLTAANGVAVKRSLYYSAADQTAHGLTAGATLHMRIWQVGMAGDGNYQQVSL